MQIRGLRESKIYINASKFLLSDVYLKDESWSRLECFIWFLNYLIELHLPQFNKQSLRLTLAMKFIQVFYAACVFLPLNVKVKAQRTFLDDLALRPTFRRIREMFLDMNKSPSHEEAFRINLRNGVS